VILPDGKQVTGKSLGANNSMDAGLIQITDKGPLPGGKWPSAPMASSTMLKNGQWCVALGHPGGFRPNRTPPLRLGRVLELRANAIRTDCTLVGGDSGGPLFDLHGRVIGIHSRIGGSLAENLHVPIDIYRLGWTRLASAEEWGEAFWRGPRGRSPPAQPTSYLGVQIDPAAGNCRVTEVFDDSPAKRAGMLPGDVIKLFDTIPVAQHRNLEAMLGLRNPGQRIDVVVEREGKRVTLSVTLGKRPEAE
jgi:serine protease Do